MNIVNSPKKDYQTMYTIVPTPAHSYDGTVPDTIVPENHLTT